MPASEAKFCSNGTYAGRGCCRLKMNDFSIEDRSVVLVYDLLLLHDDKRAAGLRLVNVVHTYGVGVPDLPRDDSLLLKTPDEKLVAHELGIHNLEGGRSSSKAMWSAL